MIKYKTAMALGTAFAAVSLSAHAAVGSNPFATQTLDSGYQLAQADTKAQDGKCGEAKCGADKKAKKSMNKDKKMDGSCGGDKKKDGQCGADKK